MISQLDIIGSRMHRKKQYESDNLRTLIILNTRT